MHTAALNSMSKTILESQRKTQGAGIRQGCPLPPYLFILVMSCIDTDINREQSLRVKNNRVPGCCFDMIYYADETILISTDTKAINELLKLTQEMSRKYGLNLNMDKCVAIKLNTEGKISFPNGNELKTEERATHLGNELNHKKDITLEINNKLNEVRRTWFQLSTYWKAKDCNQTWQLIIYDAVTRSKLFYGLETVQLTESQKKK